MDPVTAILSAASLAGAIFGEKGRQYIDPAWLKQHFGVEAVTKEINELFHNVVNSPQGQQIIGSAAETGQRFGNATERQAAQLGLTPAAGAGTGTGVFATSAGEGASNAMVNQARGNLYASVAPIAQQMVSDRMQAILRDREAGGVQNTGGRIWSKIGNAAGVALSAMPAAKAAAAPADGTSVAIRNDASPDNIDENFGVRGSKWGFLKKGGRMLSGTFGRLVHPGRR